MIRGMKNESLQPDYAMTIKAVVNWLAASLGIGTFLGLINLAVGLLSAAWLAVQLYGYVKYELPIKRYRRDKAIRDLERAHLPRAIDVHEADE